MTTDIFDNKIICKDCNKEMKKNSIIKNGFDLRVVECDECGDRIIHPHDEGEYIRFMNMKRKDYKVKLRLVGNSYAVSIPKEILDFMKESERKFDDIVKLAFDDMRKLSLFFE
ncbi:MAG: hypothetical protein KKF56_02465 [Nanoarchaeota archaeon]|nr:hypothetical protein [Nanoarchaeota archaeon]